MSNSPPFKHTISSVSSDGDDEDDFLSASSNIMPTPTKSRPKGSPPKSVAFADAQSSTPLNKPPPLKSLLIARAATTGGTAQRPPKPKRGRSVGFVDDLKITTSSSSDLGGNVTSDGNAAIQQSRPAIISQRKTSYDSVNRSSFRSSISSITGGSTTYTVDQVIASQFENEATTHIVAALENEELVGMDKLDSMERGSRLLGEGIDEQGESGVVTVGEEAGMADYSEDDDEDNVGVPAPPPGRDSGSLSSNSPISMSGPSHIRQDSFLQRVRMQNDQPQYKFDPYSPKSGSDGSSPERLTSHRRGLSSAGKSSAYLQSVPDDSVLASEDFNKRIISGVPVAPPVSANRTERPKEGSAHSGSRAVEEIVTDDNNGNGQSLPAANKIPITDKKSSEGNTTASLANRLRSLQKRSVFGSQRSSFSSSTTSSVAAGALGAEPESYSDKLIDALARADQPKHKQWWRRARQEYDQLIAPKIPVFQRSIAHSLLFVIFPCLAVAFVLFYLADNPRVGNSNTSWSWWVLFLGVRQIVVFEFTRVGEIFWIEIMALRSAFFNMIVGPYISLAIIQSKGWPYVCFFWPVLNFCFLYGSHSFAEHWLFWQDSLDIFNANNPVEGVTDSNIYFRLLLSMMFIGVAVSLKRLTISLYLGKRTVNHFGNELERLMAKMILIGEVATLAKIFETRSELFQGPLTPLNEDTEDEKMVRFKEFVQNDESSDLETPGRPKRKALGSTSAAKPPPPPAPIASFDGISSPAPPAVHRSSSGEASTHLAGQPATLPSGSAQHSDGEEKETYTSSLNAQLIYLLSEWEEPELQKAKKTNVSVKELVQFRKAVSYMDDKYPFSHAFGPAKTRVLCIESSQKVYERLMLSCDDGVSVLPFTVFTTLATDQSGELSNTKMKSLIRLFRPDRDGTLKKLDFVKSVDSVYRELRLLRASIANSAQIDCAFERMVNFFFYFFLVVISLAILGVKIWSVFLSFNTFLFGFSFLFSSAASKYVDGLLLIFLRRPYSIGDRIATSDPASDTSPNGSSTWFVDRVTLFTTTVRFATTNEVATYSNGSLASLRIINANRSPKGIIFIDIKFGLDTEFKNVKVFRSAVENFVKARPREWSALVAFRATRVEVDYGFIEYKIVCQHRECWQNIGPILQSKADLASFCLEVSKKLDMRYEQPPMPVTLSEDGINFRDLLSPEDEDGQVGSTLLERANKSMSDFNLDDVAALFEVRGK